MHTKVPLWVFAATAACSPSKMSVDLLSDTGGIDFVDSDGDGIADSVEGGDDVDTDGDGTPDYLDLDSDGDEWSDQDEVASYTDPKDPNDHPYEGGWPIDSCRNDVVPTGMQEGDILEDVRLMDQYGETVRLHDFCDHVVLIEHAGFS